MKHNCKVRTTFCNFEFWGEWEDSNREIMKMLGWLEVRKLSKWDFYLVPRVLSVENEKTLGLRERSWFQTSRWPEILKWPPKRTHEVSYLYSVVKILSDFRNPCVIFASTRPSKLRPFGSWMIERALADGEFEPFDWGRGIYWYHKRTKGPVVRRPISAKPGVKLNPDFIFLCSKEFSRNIFSVIFSGSNHQLEDKKN